MELPQEQGVSFPSAEEQVQAVSTPVGVHVDPQAAGVVVEPQPLLPWQLVLQK